MQAALAQKAQASKQQKELLDKAVQAAKTKFLPYENLPAPAPVIEELQKITRELTVVSTQAEGLKKQTVLLYHTGGDHTYLAHDTLYE